MEGIKGEERETHNSQLGSSQNKPPLFPSLCKKSGPSLLSTCVTDVCSALFFLFVVSISVWWKWTITLQPTDLHFYQSVNGPDCWNGKIKSRKWRSGCPRSARSSPQVHVPSWSRVSCRDFLTRTRQRLLSCTRKFPLVIDRFVISRQRIRPDSQRSTYIIFSLPLPLPLPLSHLHEERKDRAVHETQAKGRRGKGKKKLMSPASIIVAWIGVCHPLSHPHPWQTSHLFFPLICSSMTTPFFNPLLLSHWNGKMTAACRRSSRPALVAMPSSLPPLRPWRLIRPAVEINIEEGEGPKLQKSQIIRIGWSIKEKVSKQRGGNVMKEGGL